MDFGKAFSFTFDDPDWPKKVLLGGVITLVPILNFATYGYSLEVTRRVINNDPHPLPEWDDIGGKLVKGLIAGLVIPFVYGLPLILVGCVFQVLSIALTSVASSSSQNSDALGGLIGLVSACLGCVALIYGIFMGIVLPAAIGHYAAKDQIGVAFRFGEVLGLVQKNIGTYLMVLVISIVASFVAGFGVIACIVGVFFTSFWYLLVVGHATGQAYREASAAIGLV